MPFFTNRPQTSFKDRPLLFIDLEMTGLDVGVHEIIEIAALVVDPHSLAVTNSYYTQVSPTHIETAYLPSLKILNYSPQNWANAIPLKTALEELSLLAPNCILAGWSVQNEWDFLIHALKQHNLPYFFDNYLIEVWTLAYAKFSHDESISRLNLASVCKKLNIYFEQHKPDSDIRATYEIYKKLTSSQ